MRVEQFYNTKLTRSWGSGTPRIRRPFRIEQGVYVGRRICLTERKKQKEAKEIADRAEQLEGKRGLNNLSGKAAQMNKHMKKKKKQCAATMTTELLTRSFQSSSR